MCPDCGKELIPYNGADWDDARMYCTSCCEIYLPYNYDEES